MEYNRLRLGKSLEHKHHDGREYDDCGDNCEANPAPNVQIVPESPEVHFEIPTDIMKTWASARVSPWSFSKQLSVISVLLFARDREKLTRALHGHTQIRAAEFGQNGCVYCHDFAV